MRFLKQFMVSQRSAALYNARFVANFVLSLAVKEF